MLNKIYKYSISLFVTILLFFLIFNHFFLPWYVGSGNDYFLPDLRGTYLQNAKYKLTKLGFNVNHLESSFSKDFKPGTIIKMSPRAFTKVKSGRTITLTVAGHRKEFMMPDYRSHSYRNAKIVMKQNNLFLDTTIYEYNESYAKGIVSFQVPKPGRIISSGTYVTLGVSRGSPPEYFYVPDIIGLSLSKAKKAIIESGLRIGKIDYEYQPKLLNNTIVDQNMTEGMRVSFPASIDLVVSIDKE